MNKIFGGYAKLCSRFGLSMKGQLRVQALYSPGPHPSRVGEEAPGMGMRIASCLLGHASCSWPELGTLESNTKYFFSLHYLSLCLIISPKIVRESLCFPLPELNENKGISVELIPPFLF